MARGKKVIPLGMRLLDEIDGWRGFVATDPGKKFDGVDLADGDDGPVIVAGFSIDGDDNRERITTEDRAKIERMVAAQSGKVTAIAS